MLGEFQERFEEDNRAKFRFYTFLWHLLEKLVWRNMDLKYNLFRYFCFMYNFNM